MTREYENTNFGMNEGRQNHERIRNQFQNMEQEHERFRMGLNDQQRMRFEHRFNHMNEYREQINNRLRLMEQEMNEGQFDRIRQRNWVREMEKALDKWQEQYRKMEKELNGT